MSVEVIMANSTSSCTEGISVAESALCDQEYETQYFGFTPKSFCDGVYNAITEYIHDGLDLVQKYISQEFKDVMTEEQLQAASENMLATLIKSLDRAFDKLEVYLMSNIFYIPNNVVLPEDKVHTEKQSEESSEDLDVTIAELQEKIKSTKYFNACLRQELQDIEKVQRVYEDMIEKVQSIERVRIEIGVSKLKDCLAFAVAQSLKLQNLTKNLSPVKLTKGTTSVDDQVKSTAKRLKTT